MTQSEVEKALEGMWQNLKSNYLWSFYPSSDGQRNGIVVDDNRPVGGRFFSYEVNVSEEDIALYLIMGGIRTQHKLEFLADKIIQIFFRPASPAPWRRTWQGRWAATKKYPNRLTPQFSLISPPINLFKV